MTPRRSVLASIVLSILAPSRLAGGQAAASKRTFVIVHGAWGGGWDWRTVGDLLTSRGHVVFRPTLTGLGERAHLATADIGLSTHIADVVNLLQFENLRDVSLVGHSYGGMVVTGVADRVPERISRLAYVDAFVPEDGETVMALQAPERRAQFTAWAKDGFIVPPWVKPGGTPPGDVPHPLRTLTEPIRLTNTQRERIPTSYILTVDRGAEMDPFDRFAERAKNKGWKTDRLEADHNPQRSAPQELCALLDQAR